MKEGRGRKGHYQSQMVVAGVEKSIAQGGRRQQVGKMGLRRRSGFRYYSVARVCRLLKLYYSPVFSSVYQFKNFCVCGLLFASLLFWETTIKLWTWAKLD